MKQIVPLFVCEESRTRLLLAAFQRKHSKRQKREKKEEEGAKANLAASKEISMDAAVAARTGWYFCNKRRTKDYTDGEDVFTLLLTSLSNAADFGSPWDSDVCQVSPLTYRKNLEVLPTGSAGSKNKSYWSSLNVTETGFVQSPPQMFSGALFPDGYMKKIQLIWCHHACQVNTILQYKFTTQDQKGCLFLLTPVVHEYGFCRMNQTTRRSFGFCPPG